MLSDVAIREAIEYKALTITPFSDKYIQPASYDVHLGSKIKVTPYSLYSRTLHLDPSKDTAPWQDADLPNYYGLEQYIAPGEVMLAHIDEVVSLNSNQIAADIAGCSSLGRWFLFVHITAGFVDPGWDGQLTLELYNASPWNIRIWAGMRIAQLRFYYMLKPTLKPYGKIDSHYFMSSGPVASIYKDDGYVPSTSHS